MDNNSYPITKIDASLVPGSYDTGWQCFQFQIHNFVNLPRATLDQPLGPPIPFRCFGRNWTASIFLGGRSSCVWGDDVPVLDLAHVLGPSIDLEMKFSSASNLFVHSVIAAKEPCINTIELGGNISCSLSRRQNILDNPNLYLDDGTYTITLCMKEKGGQNIPKTFIPKNPSSKSILDMLFSSNGTSTFDVVFEVSSESNGDSPVRKFAHMFVLRSCAPTLAALCEDCPSLTPVPINNVKPIIFNALMVYIYGGELRNDLFKVHSKDIIKAADMFGITHLKIKAEVVYIQSTEITIDNVVGNFYFADTMKCALLKEKVMEYLVDNAQEVLDKLDLKDTPESSTLFRDFMTAVALGKNKNKDYDGDDPTKVKTMSINVLRRKLSERGLEIDGTREMLVASLEESYAKAKSSGEKRKRDEDTDASAAENE